MFKFNFNPDNADDTNEDVIEDTAELLPSKEIFPSGTASSSSPLAGMSRLLLFSFRR
jgi:hypothetical protein